MVEDKDSDCKPCGTITRCLGINIQMIPCKMAYFCLYASSGSYLPFVNIFLVSVGLTVYEAAFISGFCYVFSAIASPIWGFIVDLSRQRKTVFFVLCVGSASVVFAHPWVAFGIGSIDTEKCQITKNEINESTKSSSSLRNGSNNILLSSIFNGTSARNIANDDVLGCNVTRLPFSSPLFPTMMALLSVTNILIMPLHGLMDSFVMNAITTCSKESSFGSQRLFGSISFGISSFVAGVAADNYHHPMLSKYTSVFFVYLPFILLVLPLGFLLLKQTNWEVEENRTSKKDKHSNIKRNDYSNLRLVLRIFKKLDNVVFFLSVLVNGTATIILFSFLFLMMNDEMDASKTAMGVAMFISCFSEILLFFFAKKIMVILGGPMVCIELGVLSTALRLLLISYIELAWLSVPVHILHGIGFALFWAAAMEYLQQISSKVIYNTMFCLLTSIYFGCAGFIGNMAGGVIYTAHGGRVLFRYGAVLSGVWFFLMIVYFHALVHLKKSCHSIRIPEKINKDEIELTNNEEI